MHVNDCSLKSDTKVSVLSEIRGERCEFNAIQPLYDKIFKNNKRISRVFMAALPK